MTTHVLRFLRSLLGLAVGSLVAVVVYVALSALRGGQASLDVDALSLELLAGFIIIFAFSLPCGLLAHAVLYALKRRRLVAYSLAAVAEACLYGVVAPLGRISVTEAGETLTAAASAGICAAVAWLIRRPDRDAPALSKSHKDSIIVS